MNIPINITEKRSIGTFTGARRKTRGRDPGYGVRIPGLWKTRSLVENAGSGKKCGVQEENTG